jgi:hypothetical protein
MSLMRLKPTVPGAARPFSVEEGQLDAVLGAANDDAALPAVKS